MHDARRHRILTRIAAIRDAERSVAREALRLATGRERDAEDARRQAAAYADAAASDWEAHLGGNYHPELAKALGGELMQRVGESQAADEQARDMAAEREGREEEWRLGDARCRQADSALRSSRHERARDREERELGRIADRVSFDWSIK